MIQGVIFVVTVRLFRRGVVGELIALLGWLTSKRPADTAKPAPAE